MVFKVPQYSFMHAIRQMNVLFFDESRFCLRIKGRWVHDGSIRVWRHSCKRHFDLLTNSVVVVAGIRLNGRTALVVTGNLNGRQFMDEILQHMLYCKIRPLYPVDTKSENNDATLIRHVC